MPNVIFIAKARNATAIGAGMQLQEDLNEGKIERHSLVCQSICNLVTEVALLFLVDKSRPAKP
jgi:hypothetical protein